MTLAHAKTILEAANALLRPQFSNSVKVLPICMKDALGEAIMERDSELFGRSRVAGDRIVVRDVPVAFVEDREDFWGE